MRTRSWMLTLIAGLLLCLSGATSASACPMCKLANESDNRLPRAFMYSILFMLGMPMTVLGGFSIGFWRLARKGAQMQREAMEQAMAGANDPAVQATHDAAPGPALPVTPEPGLPGPGFVFP